MLIEKKDLDYSIIIQYNNYLFLHDKNRGISNRIT